MEGNKYHGRIQTAREEAGITQQELAAALSDLRKKKIARETVNQWESGTREIKAQDIIALAQALHISADELLGIPEKETGLSADATSLVREWLQLPGSGQTFEKMLECASFQEFITALSTHELFAETLQEKGVSIAGYFYIRELYEYALCRVAEAAKKLAAEMFPFKDFYDRFSGLDDLQNNQKELRTNIQERGHLDGYYCEESE